MSGQGQEPPIITSRQLDPEEAETQNVARLEEASRNNNTGMGGRRLSINEQKYEQTYHLLSTPSKSDAGAAAAADAAGTSTAGSNLKNPNSRS